MDFRLAVRPLLCRVVSPLSQPTEWLGCGCCRSHCRGPKLLSLVFQVKNSRRGTNTVKTVEPGMDRSQQNPSPETPISSCSVAILQDHCRRYEWYASLYIRLEWYTRFFSSGRSVGELVQVLYNGADRWRRALKFTPGVNVLSRHEPQLPSNFLLGTVHIRNFSDVVQPSPP